VIAQGRISGGETVDAEQANSDTQAGAIDKQREQHKPSRQNHNKALDVCRKCRMFGHGQCQHQSQGTTKPAPYDCELVVEVDAPGKAHALKWGQKHKQCESSCPESGSDEHGQQQEVMHTDV
jgi:hypothetical protein